MLRTRLVPWGGVAPETARACVRARFSFQSSHTVDSASQWLSWLIAQADAAEIRGGTTAQVVMSVT